MPSVCIEVKNETNRRYYARHRERLAKEACQYRKENPDKISAVKRRYYLSNRELIIEKTRKFHDANPEKHKISSRKSKIKNAEKRRSVSYRDNIKWKYGLGLDEYFAMFQAQGGCCAICLIPQSSLKQKLSVDHDHSTNAVRGLLCMHCNNVLGHGRDNVEVLKAAISYLEKSRA